jgi:hypothetical protein
MEYSKDHISKLMKYCNPLSIFVIGFVGQLIRLYCPFAVQVFYPVVSLEIGGVISVGAAKITLELKDFYIIEGNAYYIFCFTIII